MTNKEKLHSIFLALLVLFFLIFCSSVALAGTETRLTHGERLTASTAIYNTNVFWTETTENGVHAYDLATGKRTDINGNFAVDKINAYGNKAVWTGDAGEAVYIYDISTGNETKIASGRYLPDIYGNYIVYTNTYNDDHKNDGIYLYDLNAQKETKIAAVYSYPAIYDKTVVWSQANSNNGYDIRKYDISTNQTSTITTRSWVSELDIYGNTVVWTESQNVYMYNMTSRKITQVTDSGNVYQPAIYGNWIVYAVGELYSGDIYTYDVSSAKTTRITTSNEAYTPSIYGDKIVYADIRNLEYPDERDVFLYDLSSTVQNLPVAKFTSNITSGTVPLVVRFFDLSTGGVPTSWDWDFGDGINSKHAMNATHTFANPGMYNVTLTVANEAGYSTVTKSNYITVTPPQAIVADFSTNVTYGTAPLTVLFVDTSKVEEPTSWYWDFGDGTNSNDSAATVHTFTELGDYTISLTVANAAGNNTTTKPGYIVIYHHSCEACIHRSSGGGGVGGSPEPAKNVEVKEISQAFITNGKPVKFDFPKNATCVVYVSFDAKKTAGKTNAIAEQLKNKSTLVSNLDAGEVYKYFNVWVGTGGFATSKNIGNPVVCFKVEKAWIKDKNIDKSSITLNRYNDKKWEQFPVSLSGEDNKYLYFTAKTSGFSSFTVTGKAKPSEETVTEVQIDYPETINNNTGNKEPQTEQKEIPSISGFEVYYGIASLFTVFLYKRK
jgi:PGF-pre-PGF domain-containing protein